MKLTMAEKRDLIERVTELVKADVLLELSLLVTDSTLSTLLHAYLVVLVQVHVQLELS